jgi:hypothetical protein
VQAGDAIARAGPIPPIKKVLDDVGLAEALFRGGPRRGVPLKARDRSPALPAAASFLGLYGAMTVKGPSVRA